MKSIFEYIEWLCVGCILIAYLLVSFSFISPTHILFQLLNIVGAGGVAFFSLRKRDLQPALLNLAWVCIALIALIKLSL